MLARFLLLSASLALSAPAVAQHAHHMAPPQPSKETSAPPHEAGQSAFAAIQEIVAILDKDPATDWTKVNVEALRQHLVDMNNVTLQARVAVEPIDHGARFVVTGDGEVAASISRMVIAHAATMDGAGGWRMSAEERHGGAVITATASDAADAAKIRALGFIGIMTRGMHHQQHHLMLARGLKPHD